MGDHPERWVDARGFAMVTDYSLPTPVWPEEFWHIKKRLCGAAAARALPRLLFNIRFSLSFEHDFGTKLLKCAGASCGVSGIGEWSTHTQITFRVVPGGLALDTWSEYSSDIQPDLIAKSRAFIAKGLAELATARCAP